MNEKILKKYIDYGLKQKADELEIFYQENQEDSVEIRQQKVEKLHTAIDKGLAVRVICQNKLGFSYTTSLDEADILKTIDNAITSAKYTALDKNWTLPAPRKPAAKNLRLFDKNILELTPQQKIGIVKKLEKAAYNYDKKIKKTETAGFSSGVVHNWLINSHGVFHEEKRTYCGVSLEIIAVHKDKMEAGYEYQYAANLKQLQPQAVAQKAAKKAIEMLSAQDIATGKYDLLLTPKVSINFLSVILPMLCADNIQKNKSLLQGKLEQPIASALVTLLDDPLLPQGLGSYLLDAEGVPGQTKLLVQNGVLKQFLYDTYSANKDQTKSTGNAIRYSLKGEPDIGGSNFYLQPGKQQPKQLLSSIQHGLAIHNVMGLHTADPISGQFSLGAVGQLIENGKLTKAVKNIAIAGNLLDLLTAVSAVGNDLEFTPEGGAIGAPSIIINNISVAGNAN